MNRTIAATILLASWSPVALAQTEEPSATVSLTHDDADSIISLGDSVTWSLEITFEGAEVASSINAAILATKPGLASSSDMTYTNTIGGNNGGTSDGNGGISFVNFTNTLVLEFWPHVADRSNPFLVGTFQTTALDRGDLTYSFSLGEAAEPFLTTEVNAFSPANFSMEQVTFNIDTLTIVPAPASALLLAPAGLLITRRRR